MAVVLLVVVKPREVALSGLSHNLCEHLSHNHCENDCVVLRSSAPSIYGLHGSSGKFAHFLRASV